MILKCVSFADVVAAGAPYYGASRQAEPPLQIPHFGRIIDSPDDLVVLDDAILTPPVGIAWRGFWISDAVQYMGPNDDWQKSSWLPGAYNAADHTIDIHEAKLRPEITATGPLFYVDSTVGHRNFAHFVFDTLPYGLFFQRARQAVTEIRPILSPLKFPHQKNLFEAVFDLPYSAAVLHTDDRPTLVRRLALPRRQTDMEHEPWRFSFAGIRHIRDAAIARWGRTAHRPEPRQSHRWDRRNPAPVADRRETSPLKIHLHRIQDVETLRRAGNLRGRNFSNLDALCPLLLAKGYVVYEPALVPLDHLVADLNQAHIVVTVHGAGLANAVFSPPGTQVYEITGQDNNWRCFEALSTVLGHRFVELHQPMPPDPDKPFLDLDWLRQVL